MSFQVESPGRRPWFREVWPWLLMLPPALAVSGGVAMIYLAMETPTVLVVDDYAEIEALTLQRFERDREALRLGLSAELVFVPQSGRIDLSLLGPASFELPATLVLSLQHAADPSADREVRLSRAGETFTALAQPAPGAYRLELLPEDGAWRLGAAAGRLDGTISLRPQSDGI